MTDEQRVPAPQNSEEPCKGTLRVLILHNRYKLHGGEDVVVQQEAELLRQAGHAVQVVEVSNDDIAGLRGQITTGLTTIYSAASRQRVGEALRAHRADVLHVHNFFPKLSPSVYDAAADAGCAVVQTLHNYRLVCPAATLFRDGHICTECLGRTVAWPGIQHGCYRGSRLGSATIAAMASTHRLLGTWRRKCHRYITLNDFARQVLVENAGLPPSRVCVKPNLVEDRAIGQGRGEYALFVGRLSPEKGIGTLLEAARSAEFPLRLLVAGTGPMEAEVKAAASVFPDRLTALGSQTREQVQKLLDDALVQIVPSEWHEAGGPLTIGEAFAAGVPVVTTRLEPMATVVRDGQDGLLYASQDAGDLCRALQRLLAQPEKLFVMRRSARSRYEQLYRPEANLAALLKVYADAIETSREDKVDA